MSWSLNLLPVPVCFSFQVFHFTITYWLFIARKSVWQCACLYISALRWTADMSRYVPHHHTIPAGTGSSLSVPDKRGLGNGWMGRKSQLNSASHTAEGTTVDATWFRPILSLGIKNTVLAVVCGFHFHFVWKQRKKVSAKDRSAERSSEFPQNVYTHRASIHKRQAPRAAIFPQIYT